MSFALGVVTGFVIFGVILAVAFRRNKTQKPKTYNFPIRCWNCMELIYLEIPFETKVVGYTTTCSNCGQTNVLVEKQHEATNK